MAEPATMPAPMDEPVTDESDGEEAFLTRPTKMQKVAPPSPAPSSARRTPVGASPATTPTGGAGKDVPVSDIEWEKDVVDVSWRWHWLRIQTHDMRRCVAEEARFLAEQERAQKLAVDAPRESERAAGVADDAGKRALRTSGMQPPAGPRRLLQRRVQSYVLASQSHDWVPPGARTVHGGGGGGGGGSNNNKPSNVVHFREPHPLFSFRGASTISSRKKPSSYPLAALATISNAVAALSGHTTHAAASKAGAGSGSSSGSGSSKSGGKGPKGGVGGTGKARSRPKSSGGRPRTPSSGAARKRASGSARSGSDRKRKPPRTRDYDINSISVPLQTNTAQAIVVAKPKNIECPGVRQIAGYWEAMDALAARRDAVLASTGVDSDEDTADEAYFRRHVIKEELEKKQLLPKLRRRKETVAAAAARAAAELRMEDVPLPAFDDGQRARVQSPLPRDTLLALAGRTRVKMDVVGYCGTPTKALKFWDDLTPHKAIQLPDDERNARAAAAQARYDEQIRIRREIEAAQAEALKSPRARGSAGGGSSGMGGALGGVLSPGALPSGHTQVLWRDDNEPDDLLFQSGDDASDADPEFSLGEPARRRRDRDRKRDRNRNRNRNRNRKKKGGAGKGKGKGKGKGGVLPGTPASAAALDVRTPSGVGGANARAALQWGAPAAPMVVPVPPPQECGQWRGKVAVDEKARTTGKSGIKLCFRQLKRPTSAPAPSAAE